MVLTNQQLVTSLCAIGSDLSKSKMTQAAAEVEFVQLLKTTKYAYFGLHFESASKSVTSLLRYIYTVILTIDGFSLRYYK